MFIDDLTVFFRLKSDSGFAESVTYTPKGGVAGATFPLIFDELEEAVEVTSNQADHGFIKAQVKTTDADTNNMTAKYHANKENRDFVTVDGVEFGVLKVQADKNGMTFLELERNVALKQ